MPMTSSNTDFFVLFFLVFLLHLSYPESNKRAHVTPIIAHYSTNGHKLPGKLVLYLVGIRTVLDF